MKILLHIQSQQKGFLISLANLLQKDHEVYLYIYDSDIQRLLLNYFDPQIIIIKSDKKKGKGLKKILCCAIDIESKYNVKMSKILSMDRALGRGYLSNVDKYPQIGKAWWSYEKKLEHIITQFYEVEDVFNELKPDLYISLMKDPVIFNICSIYNVPYLSLAPVKLGERFLWSDNMYLTSSNYLQAIKANLTMSIDELTFNEYSQEASSKFVHDQIKYSAKESLAKLFHQIKLETYKQITGRRSNESYSFLGWSSVIIRRYHSYKYFCKYGLKPEGLNGRRVCYIPLHLEPEMALLSLSPEFNNSFEMISWVSKSVPADVVVVIKENPLSYGVRSKWYYDQLRQIGNVELAHPEVTSWQWIDAASITATITGTAGTESVIFKKPVLSFGAHQAINLLPTVRFCDNYRTTRTGVDELLALDTASPDFEHARRALYSAQLDTSFELQGFSKTYKSAEPQQDMAAVALSALAERLEGFSWTNANT